MEMEERLAALEDKVDRMEKAFKVMTGQHILNAAAAQERTESMHDQAQQDVQNAMKARKMMETGEKPPNVET